MKKESHMAVDDNVRFSEQVMVSGLISYHLPVVRVFGFVGHGTVCHLEFASEAPMNMISGRREQEGETDTEGPFVTPKAL